MTFTITTTKEISSLAIQITLSETYQCIDAKDVEILKRWIIDNWNYSLTLKNN